MGELGRDLVGGSCRSFDDHGRIFIVPAMSFELVSVQDLDTTIQKADYIEIEIDVGDAVI